ncbi:MAG: M23 family metallopeptidase [Treponema sp.]|jgi:murein DD-endopeptidase MepM/ murein hydrolase activator NlpD|nr:M23 family metallopeptidase [Treponema sp.]
MTVRIRSLVLIFALVTASGFAQETVHIIQKGETIYSIARNYGADIQGILRLNGIQDPTKIQAGQRIKIPGGGKESGQGAVSSDTAYTEYLVVRGDSLFGIARKYGVTLQELRAANGLREDYMLKAGDRLKIPQSGGTPPVLAAGDPSNAGAASGGSGRIESGVSGSGAAGGTAIQPAARQTAPAVSGGQTVWPVRVKELAYMTGKLYGVAILGERSESVKSLSQGTVISAGPYRGFGKVAIVQMTGGYLYVYGGCESLSVKEGDRVAPGTELGRLGLDGVMLKPQLFLMVYKNNVPIDPAKAPRL